MVIVVKADPLFAQHGGGPWEHEKAKLNLVAEFISSLPEEQQAGRSRQYNEIPASRVFYPLMPRNS